MTATTRKRAAAKKAAPSNGRRTPAKPKVPQVEVLTVTPTMAMDWLEHNVHNRPLRQKRVDDLAAAIERGEWAMNADPVRFATDGTLLDGQHRLWAIATADQAVQVLVVRGLDMQSQETMDMGARRNLRDVLALRGYASGSQLAAAVNYWWRYENGYVRVFTARPTIAQALDTLEQHPTLPSAVRLAEPIFRRFRIQVGPAVATRYEFTSINSEQADDFLGRLLEPKGLHDGSPILALRRWLERRNEQSAGGARSDAVVIHALMNKAWNAYRAGHPVEVLSWKATGLKAEGFPGAE